MADPAPSSFQQYCAIDLIIITLKYVSVAFNANNPKDVNDTGGASRLIYSGDKNTGAFTVNRWRISLGGEWRIAAATYSPF